jgi:TatA/E family protein of Tat protein translocase
MRFGPTELLILFGIIVLLFGTTRIPKLARSIREARAELDPESTSESTSETK